MNEKGCPSRGGFMRIANNSFCGEKLDRFEQNYFLCFPGEPAAATQHENPAFGCMLSERAPSPGHYPINRWGIRVQPLDPAVDLSQARRGTVPDTKIARIGLAIGDGSLSNRSVGTLRYDSHPSPREGGIPVAGGAGIIVAAGHFGRRLYTDIQASHGAHSR